MTFCRKSASHSKNETQHNKENQRHAAIQHHFSRLSSVPPLIVPRGRINKYLGLCCQFLRQLNQSNSLLRALHMLHFFCCSCFYYCCCSCFDPAAADLISEPNFQLSYRFETECEGKEKEMVSEAVGFDIGTSPLSDRHSTTLWGGRGAIQHFNRDICP